MITKARCVNTLALFALSAILAGCGSEGEEADSPLDDVPSGNTLVFEGRGRAQCDFTGGITPAQSAMKLTSAGVDVLQSGCGVMTGVAFAAVCGGASGEILLHEIRTANLDAAERAGFIPARELVSGSAGTGFMWVDCATGAARP